MKNGNPLYKVFIQRARELSYQRGDTIIRAGDIPSGVYLIVEGWVKVYSLCGNGEPNIVMSLAGGDVFPLDWAVSGDLREVSFAAMETTSVLRVSREEFLHMAQVDPVVSEAILKKLTRYFWQLSNELENLPYRSARERVAFRLVSLAERFGQAAADPMVLSVNVPNDFIARSSNMTRETASREISWLARKNIIEHRNSLIVINDLTELKRQAGKYII